VNFRTFFWLLYAFAVAALLGMLLGAGGNALDEFDHQKDVRLYRDRLAAEHCRERHGESSFEYSASGELVCIPRHGKKVIASTY
jgi:hypothetical protein